MEHPKTKERAFPPGVRIALLPDRTTRTALNLRGVRDAAA